MSLKNCKLAKRINHQFSSALFDFFHSFPVCAQLRWLRDISLMGVATPPSPRRGIPAHSVFLVCCKLSGEIRISEDSNPSSRPRLRSYAAPRPCSDAPPARDLNL